MDMRYQVFQKLLKFRHTYVLALGFCLLNFHSAFAFSPIRGGEQNAWFSPLDPMSARFAERDNVEYNGMLVVHGKKISLKGNVAQLRYIFDALTTARGKKVHIAHWGDSIILGDIISEGLRENLQKQYGGNGVGFVSMNCDDYGMRNSTIVSFSNDWKEGSIFKRNADKLPLGINGSVYSPVHGSWVKYEIGKVSKTMRNFSTIRLFYASAPAGAVVKYNLSNGNDGTIRLESGANLKEATLNLPANVTSIKFNFDFAGGYFYGVSFENGNGVYVDNLPIRGNTGVALADLPLSLLKEFNAKLNYKLIIINFGVNVVSPEHNNYIWYEQRMEKVIEFIKSAFPQASILVISIGDKAIKKGTRFITDPGIPSLLRTQQVIAEKGGTAFWNLFEAMGGENSVVDWVEANPPLSAKDYCHLTPAGGRLVSDLLFEALMKEKK
jgi:hypothetical protein